MEPLRLPFSYFDPQVVKFAIASSIWALYMQGWMSAWEHYLSRGLV